MAAVANSSLSRPPFGTFRVHLPEDPLASEQRLNRQRAAGKFPATYATYDILSFQEKNEAFFRRFADTGERRVDAPRRCDTPVVDPVNGFTSVGADAEDGNYKQIAPLVVKDHRPQSAIPYGRPIASPVSESKDQNAPWKEKKKELEQLTQSQFPGSKEAKDPLRKVPSTSELLKNKEWRDAVATRAFYTSETQKLYSGVDWSAMIPPSISPPLTTMELQPDMVSFRFTTKRYAPRAELWQHMGSRPHSWDFVQSRNGHHAHGLMNFCSPSKKTGHIPGYRDCFEAGGFGNVRFMWASFRVWRKRSPQKAIYSYLNGTLTEAKTGRHIQYVNFLKTVDAFFRGCHAHVMHRRPGRRGNIPGYTGCVLFTAHHPSHSREPDPKASTTARVHRELKVPTQVQLSPFRHKGPMSRMVTLTCPYNPFNKI